jgi:PEP-CTERM motif
LEGNLRDRDDGPGEYFRSEHPDPFRRALGVQEVPEPGTLLLMGAGPAALALWKRRTITRERRIVRFF